tara:strand:+ start:703 stop:1443 length:741 start_codon:yes stop_codon:yes gene_type:complete
MKNKKLLVIIPYYNVEKHLEEAIEGIIQQTYQNWHLVLIDDASTDNSRQVAEKYKNNKKIDLLYNSENKGCYSSVNQALSTFSDSDWDYWHYHGGDDVSDLGRLEKVMGYLHENPKIIGCKSTFIRMYYDTKEVALTHEGKPNIGTSEGIAFYSREAFNNLGYYHNTRFGGDTDYFWRLEAWVKNNNLDYQLGAHEEILYIAYKREDGLTTLYNWTHDRPKYWGEIQKEINQKMIPNNNFYREIFE